MQLCVGTSMAIIIPTSIRSYVTHKAKGMVLNDVMRAWAVPGARAYRRHLATAAVKPGACAEVLAEALALVVDTPAEPAQTAAA